MPLWVHRSANILDGANMFMFIYWDVGSGWHAAMRTGRPARGCCLANLEKVDN